MKLESVNIDFNDDNTVTYRMHIKPKKKKSSNGAEQRCYSDPITGTAGSLEDAVSKIKKHGNKDD